MPSSPAILSAALSPRHLPIISGARAIVMIPLAAIAPHWPGTNCCCLCHSRPVRSSRQLSLPVKKASIWSSRQHSAPLTFVPAGHKHATYTVDVPHPRSMSANNRQHYCSAASPCSAAHLQLAARTTTSSGPASTLLSRTSACLTRTMTTPTTGLPPPFPTTHDDGQYSFPTTHDDGQYFILTTTHSL